MSLTHDKRRMILMDHIFDPRFPTYPRDADYDLSTIQHDIRHIEQLLDAAELADEFDEDELVDGLNHDRYTRDEFLQCLRSELVSLKLMTNSTVTHEDRYYLTKHNYNNISHTFSQRNIEDALYKLEETYKKICSELQGLSIKPPSKSELFDITHDRNDGTNTDVTGEMYVWPKNEVTINGVTYHYCFGGTDIYEDELDQFFITVDELNNDVEGMWYCGGEDDYDEDQED